MLQHARHHKSGKDLMADDGVMLLVLDRLSARAVVDVREFIARFVTLILMGNTGAHLKNWALLYPDSRSPHLAPFYDPVCITAFFEGDLPSIRR